MSDGKRQRSVYMPDELWTAVRKASIDQGITTSLLIERIISEHLNLKVTPITVTNEVVTEAAKGRRR